MTVAGRFRPGAVPIRQNTLVTVMFFAAGIVFLDRFGITFLFPHIGPELRLSNSQLGSLVSVTAVAWAVSGLVFSIISDRLGTTKWLIVMSLVLFSCAVGLIGVARDYGTMLMLRALIGLFEGPALPLIQGAVARASSPDRRGRNMGIVIAGTLVIGSALAPGIMVGLASAVGWRQAFPLVAVPGVVCAVLVAAFMREVRPAPGEVVRKVTARDFGLVLADRNILLGLVGSVIAIGVGVGFGTFAAAFLAAEGLPPAASTLVLTVYGITIALGSVIAPSVSDRIGRRPALVVAAICNGLLPLFFVLFSHALPVLLGSLVVGLMGGGALTLITYVVPGESVRPELVATAFALQVAVGETVGGALGPQVGGVLADATHTLVSPLLLFAAAPLALAAIALLLRETAPRSG